jgi:hypothetical protein
VGDRPRDSRLRGLAETRVWRATKTRSKTSPYRQRDLKPRNPARQQAAMTRPRQTAAPTGRGAPASSRGRGRSSAGAGCMDAGGGEGRPLLGRIWTQTGRNHHGHPTAHPADSAQPWFVLTQSIARMVLDRGSRGGGWRRRERPCRCSCRVGMRSSCSMVRRPAAGR